MKTINYRGGIVSFDIPSNWQEDCDPEGSARFYAEGDDTGTMRLNVLSFERKDDVAPDRVANEVFKGNTPEILANGILMRYSMAQVEEGGELLHLHRWDILVAVPPQQWRLVCFGFTALASQAADAQTKEEFRVVDHAVRNARYSSEPGALPPKS